MTLGEEVEDVVRPWCAESEPAGLDVLVAFAGASVELDASPMVPNAAS